MGDGTASNISNAQRKWAIWGVVLWLVAIALFGSIFGGVFFALRNSEAYQLAVTKLVSNTAAMSALGAPISTGIPSGEISTKDTSGEAKLNFSVTGTKAKGQLLVEAVKKDGIWSLKVLKLKIDGRADVIDLLKDSRVELDAPVGVFATAARAPTGEGRGGYENAPHFFA
jgi:hypothetical protein